MKDERLIMAYLAGVMDGDGSFSIGRLSKGSLNPLYFPLLQCSKWRTEFLDLLKETFGGHINVAKGRLMKSGKISNPLATWQLHGSENCFPALTKLVPFLQIKAKRAEVLLEFIEKCPFVRGKPLTEDQLALREDLYLKSVNLNDWTQCSESIVKKLATKNSDDEEFWAYVAGMMDTDGSFSVKRQMVNKGTHVKNPRYMPIISLSMTDTRGINYIRRNCILGKFYIPKNKTTMRGFHYLFGIYTKSECAEFIRRILPYLRCKSENAKVLLDFCLNSKNTAYCKEGIPSEELAFRDMCYTKLCELNKYGVVKSFLMDLKTLPGDAEGNKAQAGDMPCSVNVASGETSKDDTVL